MTSEQRIFPVSIVVSLNRDDVECNTDEDIEAIIDRRLKIAKQTLLNTISRHSFELSSYSPTASERAEIAKGGK